MADDGPQTEAEGFRTALPNTSEQPELAGRAAIGDLGVMSGDSHDDDSKESEDSSETSDSTEDPGDDPRPRDAIFNELYRRHSDYADFLKDFGTSEPFLIDGDGLIAFSISNELLDWAHGGQFLHLTFIVEDFLNRLRQIGAVFELFFFAGNSCEFDRLGPTIRLARDAIMHHLRVHADTSRGVKVHLLGGSWVCCRDCADAVNGNPEWQKLVATFNPSFILSSTTVEMDGIMSEHQCCFVQNCLLQDLHVVTVNELTLRGSEVIAFVLKPPLDLMLRKEMEHNVESNRAPNSTGIDRTKVEHEILHLIQPQKPLMIRELLVVCALKEMSRTTLSENEECFAAILVVHTLLLKTLPLAERALALEPARLEDPEATGSVAQLEHHDERSFINAIHSSMSRLLETYDPMTRLEQGGSNPDSEPFFSSGLADLFDGRLFHALVLLAGDGLALPKEVYDEASSIWNEAGLATVFGHDFCDLGCLSVGPVSPEERARALSVAAAKSTASIHHAERIPDLVAFGEGDSFMPATVRRVQERMSACLPSWPRHSVSDPIMNPKQVPFDPSPEQQATEHQACASPDDEVTWENQSEADCPTLVDSPCSTVQRTTMAATTICAGAASVSALDEENTVPDQIMKKFVMDHHFHSTRPLCSDPDHLTLLQGHGGFLERIAQQRGYSNFARLKFVEKHKFKTAAAVMKTANSLLHGLPVDPQIIVEKLTAEQLSARREAAVMSLTAQAGDLTADTTPSRDQTSAPSNAFQSPGARKKQVTVSAKSKQLVEQNKEKMRWQAIKDGRSKLQNLRRELRPSAPMAQGPVMSYVERLQKHNLELSNSREMKKLDPFVHSLLLYELGLEVLDVLQALPIDALRTKETFQTLQHILRVPQEHLALLEAEIGLKELKNRQKSLAKCAASVGFQDMAEIILGKPVPNLKTVARSSILYQLETVPEHLLRPSGVAGGDPRVKFQPDQWQVRLLDIVDCENSALVVAPTASGKTFISYYIMEKCLRTDDDGVVVFVAPTKALVNQVWKELGARFSKQYPKGVGKLSGVFTRDHRDSVMECQILVTVPQCLSILLLSAEKANLQWATRIRHVILDEVHVLGSAGGEIWEQLILLLHVPFVALSATLGDVSGFLSWLRKVETSKGRDVYLVEHKDRQNDLFPWVYDPDTARLVDVHPFAALDSLMQENPIKEFPEDLKLLPEHCVSAWEAMKADVAASRVDELSPDVFFRARTTNAEWNISMQDVRAWEAEIKAEFCRLPHRSQWRVVSSVGGQTLRVFENMNAFLGSSQSQFATMSSHLRTLVLDLTSRQLLPALCFHMNRRGCNQFAKFLSQTLRSEEVEARRLEKWEEKVQRVKHDLQHLRRIFSTGTAEEIALDQEVTRQQRQELRSKLDLLLGVDSRFVLVASSGSQVQTSEILEALNLDDVSRVQPNMMWLFRAMQRGIGVHHSGLNTKWRQATEHLMRIKRLGVVFATGTLAMGINFPCKSSVLLGDAVYLNAMLYRQATGRAGRRGMDLRGHTIFYALPSNKICRLMRARLPRLLGNIVLSPSLVLRLLMRQSILHSAVDAVSGRRKLDLQRHQEIASAACARLVELPLFSPTHALFTEQASNNFQFCVEFLHSQGLLMRDEEGCLAPNDLSALISHLYFMEPSNFAFLTILRSGYLADLCAPHPLREERVVTLLSQLFCRRPVPRRIEEWLRKEERKGPSVIVLPPPEAEVKDILGQHSAKALTTLQDFWQGFAVGYAAELGEDNRLPLTGSLQGGSRHAAFPAIQPLSLRCKVRSLFVALSGHDDQFYSIADICNTTRAGLHIDAKLIPVFEFSSDAVNSYILDFYKHGQERALRKYNGLHDDEIWERLNEFDLCVKALHAAMERRVSVHREWVKYADPNVLDTFKAIIDKFHSQLRSIAY